MTKVKKGTTVEASPETVYAVWRNFENFPAFMRHIEDVRVTSDRMSHWRVSGPLGLAAEWDAEITLDQPNEAIGWRTIEGDSSVITAGRVNFRREGSTRTHLDVTIEYAAPGGPLGDLVARVFANPDRHVEEDLSRFRDIVEGAVARDLPTRSASQTSARMGAVTEHDLPDSDRIERNANVAPADSHAFSEGRPRERWLD